MINQRNSGTPWPGPGEEPAVSYWSAGAMMNDLRLPRNGWLYSGSHTAGEETVVGG